MRRLSRFEVKQIASARTASYLIRYTLFRRLAGENVIDFKERTD